MDCDTVRGSQEERPRVPLCPHPPPSKLQRPCGCFPDTFFGGKGDIAFASRMWFSQPPQFCRPCFQCSGSFRWHRPRPRPEPRTVTGGPLPKPGASPRRLLPRRKSHRWPLRPCARSRNAPSRESTLCHIAVSTKLRVCSAPLTRPHAGGEWSVHLWVLFLSLSLHKSMGEAVGSEEHQAGPSLCRSISMSSADRICVPRLLLPVEYFLGGLRVRHTSTPGRRTLQNTPDPSRVPQAAELGFPWVGGISSLYPNSGGQAVLHKFGKHRCFHRCFVAHSEQLN